jgi:hypothetical protein
MGGNHSEETKAKLSAAQKGKTLSEESKAKISATKKGRTFSEEHKAEVICCGNKGTELILKKLKQNCQCLQSKGKTLSEEHESQNMSAAQER